MDTETFKQLKELCAAKGLLGDTSDSDTDGDDTAVGIHDDATLLRFLRAREYDVAAAMQQYTTTRKWRDANHLLEVYESIDIAEYEETRKLYTHWTGRRDRTGAPVCLFEVQKITASPPPHGPEALKRLFCTYEHLTRFVLPLCSAVARKPVTNATCIVDISAVSLYQLWKLRSHMQSASVLATAHYPETLGTTYVIGAPAFFETVWGWINAWFAPNTVAKIRIVPPGRELAELSKVIESSDIPQKYGGEHAFNFGMDPDLDNQIREAVKWTRETEVPKGPLRWITSGGDRKVIAVGKEAGVQRHEEIFTFLDGTS